MADMSDRIGGYCLDLLEAMGDHCTACSRSMGEVGASGCGYDTAIPKSAHECGDGCVVSGSVTGCSQHTARVSIAISESILEVSLNTTVSNQGLQFGIDLLHNVLAGANSKGFPIGDWEPRWGKPKGS